VERGTFRKVLTKMEEMKLAVPMLYEHQVGLPLLASTRSGTLRLSEDAKGLAVSADVADTTLGRDLRVLAKRGDLGAMSYGFVAGRGNSKFEFRSGKPHRTLIGFKHLTDVSPTWDPVFASAEGQFRSLAMQYVDSPESLQQLHAGVYPQLVEQGGDSTVEVTDANPTPTCELQGCQGGCDNPLHVAKTDEEAEARSKSEASPDDDASGASSSRAALAARKRRLAVMSISLKE
jgi:HK97 family phage prohead protease